MSQGFACREVLRVMNYVCCSAVSILAIVSYTVPPLINQRCNAGCSPGRYDTVTGQTQHIDPLAMG